MIRQRLMWIMLQFKLSFSLINNFFFFFSNFTSVVFQVDCVINIKWSKADKNIRPLLVDEMRCKRQTYSIVVQETTSFGQKSFFLAIFHLAEYRCNYIWQAFPDIISQSYINKLFNNNMFQKPYLCIALTRFSFFVAFHWSSANKPSKSFMLNRDSLSTCDLQYVIFTR